MGEVMYFYYKKTVLLKRCHVNAEDGGLLDLQNREYLATVRNKKVIDSERVQGHYLPVMSMILGKGGRDDLGARMF